MLVAQFTATDGLWVALSAFLLLVGLGLLLLLLRLAASAGRLGSLIQGLELELLPVVGKAGGTIDRVNAQLDKLDQVTESAVDAAASVDSAVRVVTHAVATPIRKLSGLGAALAHGAATLRARGDFRAAYVAAREAADRREQDIVEELERSE